MKCFAMRRDNNRIKRKGRKADKRGRSARPEVGHV